MKAHLEPEEETMAQHSCEDEPSGPWVCVRGWEERELGSGLTLGCHRTAWTPEASGEKGGPGGGLGRMGLPFKSGGLG